MLNLLEGVILVVSLLVIFVIIERIRIATGKEVLIDKLIRFVENVYLRTTPNEHKEIDLRGCHLPGKVQLVKVYFNDTKSK